MLPFGNVSATLTINGAELKTYLETAVSAITASGNGRFGEVSGLCFTYDIAGTPASFGPDTFVIPGTGNRVTGAVRQAADGTCTGAAISFLASDNYTLTTNDFTASGGDGYPNFRSRMTTQDTLDQDLADYIATLPDHLIHPVLGPRIVCTDSDLDQRAGLPGRVAVAGPVSRRLANLVRRTTAAALAAAVVMLLAITSTAAHEGGPRLILEPDPVNPGGVVLIRGEDLALDEHAGSASSVTSDKRISAASRRTARAISRSRQRCRSTRRSGRTPSRP